MMYYRQLCDALDAMVLGAVKSYDPARPATLGDLWGMIAIQRQCYTFGVWDAKAVLDRSIQRLKKAGKIMYSSKPAGWVVCK
jgi:hypothetical protein